MRWKHVRIVLFGQGWRFEHGSAELISVDGFGSCCAQPGDWCLHEVVGIHAPGDCHDHCDRHAIADRFWLHNPP